MPQEYMGKDGFVWFVGVVEDRDDPEQMGRVRVRCLGYHTDDLILLPTKDLPWATVMFSTTVPSMNGLGETPPFLVEGSWVMGFFQDAAELQLPVVMGSLPGFNLEKPNYTKGFSDPFGNYPRWTGEPDINRLARGSIGERHPSLEKRRAMKQTKIPIALKPFLKSTDPPSTQETLSTWDEIDPKSNTASLYPYNHVNESESGHVHETDDSPGGERLLTYHKSGSFEEIHPKGDKMVKVVGDNYEIICGSSNVYIDGNANITVHKNLRMRVDGDYVLEVAGDYTQRIGGSQRTKIGAKEGGNKYEEIIGSWNYHISEQVKGTVDKDYSTVIGGSETRKIQGDSLMTVGKKWVVSAKDNIGILSQEGDMSVTTKSGIMSLKSGTKLNIKSATLMHIKSETTIDMDATTEVDVDSALINLN